MATTRSYALEVVWQFAADEAVNAGSDFIDPEHFLVGICSIEKLFSTDREKVKVTTYSLANIRAEWQDTLALLLAAKLTPSTLRRELRPELPKGRAVPGKARTVNRSDRSRAVFARAEKSAEQAGSMLVGITYVLEALLHDHRIAELLRGHCTDYAGFQASVALTARRPLQPRPAVAQKAATSESMLGQISPERKLMGD